MDKYPAALNDWFKCSVVQPSVNLVNIVLRVILFQSEITKNIDHTQLLLSSPALSIKCVQIGSDGGVCIHGAVLPSTPVSVQILCHQRQRKIRFYHGHT